MFPKGEMGTWKMPKQRYTTGGVGVNSLADSFEAILGMEGVLHGDALRARATSHWDASPMRAACLLRPRSARRQQSAYTAC